MNPKISISVELQVMQACDWLGNRSQFVELATSVFVRQIADRLVSWSDDELRRCAVGDLGGVGGMSPQQRVESRVADLILAERRDLAPYTSVEPLRRVGEVIDRVARMSGGPTLPLDGIRAATALALASKIESENLERVQREKQDQLLESIGNPMATALPTPPMLHPRRRGGLRGASRG
jgi:hypothetical protein